MHKIPKEVREMLNQIVKVILKADTKQAEKDIEKVKKKTEKNSPVIKPKVDTADIKKLEKTTNSVNNKFQKYIKNLQKASKEKLMTPAQLQQVKNLENKLEEVSRDYKDLSKQASEFNRKHKEAFENNTASASIKAISNSYKKELGDIQTELDKTQSELNNLYKNTEMDIQTDSVMSKIQGIASAIKDAFVVKLVVDGVTNQAQTSYIVDNTASLYRNGTSAAQISKSLNKARSNLGNRFSQAAINSAGYAAVQAGGDLDLGTLEAVVTYAGALSKQTGESIEETTRQLVNAIKGAGYEINEASAQYVANQAYDLYDLAQDKNALSALGDSNLTGIIQYGVTLEDIVATSKEFAGTSFETQDIINTIHQTMKKINSASPELIKDFEKIGISLDEDAISAKGFTEWLADAYNKANKAGRGDLIQDITPRDREGLDLILKTLSKIKKTQKEIGKDNALDKAFGQTSESAAARWEASINRIKAAWGSIMETLLPALEFVAGTVSVIAGIIDAMPGPVKFLIGLIIGGVAAFTALSLVLGVVKSLHIGAAIASGVHAIQAGALAVANTAAAAATSGLGAALYALAPVLLLIGALVLGVVYAIWFFRENFNDAGAAALDTGAMVMNGMMTLVGGIWNFVNIIVDGIFTVVEAMVNAIGKAFAALGENSVMQKVFPGMSGNGLQNWKMSRKGLNASYAGAAAVMEKGLSNIQANKASLKANQKNSTVNYNPFKQALSELMDTSGALESSDLLKDLERLSTDGTKGMEDIEDATERVIDAMGDLAYSLDDVKSKFTSLLESFRDKANSFDRLSYKVVNANSLLEDAAYNNKLMVEWKKTQDALLARNDISAELKNTIAGMGVDQLGTMQALLSMSSAQILQMGDYWKQNTTLSQAAASQATIQQMTFEIYESSNAEVVAEEIYKILKKKGLAV